MPNEGEDLGNYRIADRYTSLLHLSGQTGTVTSAGEEIEPGLRANINPIYDGAGTMTGLSLSSLDDRVIINNYIAPSGYGTPTEWLEAFYPIGSVIMTVNNNNPSGRIKGTKWCRVGEGRFFVGVGQDTVVNQSLEAQTYKFTPGIDGELIEETTEDVGSGNIAGEGGVQLEIKHLPGHYHVTNTRTQPATPSNNESGASNAHFMFYFGPQVNPAGLNKPETYAFLEQDRIEAFQNNTEYGDEVRYRTEELKRRHNDGYRYTDEDFNPTLGTFSLDEWGSSLVGGPGWAGILHFNDPATHEGAPTDEHHPFDEYITDSPRPIDVVWPNNSKIIRARYDPRDTDRVHPGLFRDSQLLAARNLLMSVLGPAEAKIALADVDRLKELGETIEDQNFNIAPPTFTTIQLPSDTLANSTNTGKGGKHNNVPPSYGAYFWVRIPNEQTCPGELIRPAWTGTITRDKVSSGSGPHDDQTNSGQFNVGEWAKNHGSNPWNGSDPVVITIAGADQSEEVDKDGNKRPVYIYSDDPGDDKAAGMVITEFSRGLTLINNGFIMGRGGNGGARWNNGSGKGQDGGDAIKLLGGNGSVVIENVNGKIAGGGGGGGGAGRGNFSGGGGGAGGGAGGRSTNTNSGGNGGAPGEPGTQGRYYVWYLSGDSLKSAAANIITDDHGPAYNMVPGIGGEAGGSGGGGKLQTNGRTSNGTGGGGGRVLTAGATGGGTGGPPGAEFGGLDVDGKIKGFGDGPRFNNGRTSYNNGAPTVGWTRGYCNRRPCVGRNGYEVGKPMPDWVTPVTRPHGAGHASNFNYGAVWWPDGKNGKAGIPFVMASIQCSGNKQYLADPRSKHAESGSTVNAPVSPTGWNGAYHYSTYIAGGGGDQPGFPLAPNASNDVNAYVAGITTIPTGDIPGTPVTPGGSGPLGDYAGGGGGGWGADGGATNKDIPAGVGGNAVRGGQIQINGGIIYGTQE